MALKAHIFLFDSSNVVSLQPDLLNQFVKHIRGKIRYIICIIHMIYKHIIYKDSLQK